MTDDLNDELRRAVRDDNIESVKRLLDLGGDPNTTNHCNLPPLFYAVQNENVDMVALLLANGADKTINNKASESKESRSALHNAVISGRDDIAKMLLEHGASQESIWEEMTFSKEPLMVAASRRQDLPMMRLLLDFGASVEEKSADGYTLLLDAAINNRFEALDFLINSGANLECIIDSNAFHNATPLLCAIDLLNYRTAERLLHSGANVNAKSNKGDTGLMIAVNQNNQEMVDLLLKFDANPNIVNNDGIGPLYHAMNMRHGIAMMKSLLKAGANQNMVCRGSSVLQSAVFRGNIDFVKLLLEYEANPDIANEFGQTAMDIAEKGKHTEISAILAGFIEQRTLTAMISTELTSEQTLGF